jgi:hypothetical protein
MESPNGSNDTTTHIPPPSSFYNTFNVPVFYMRRDKGRLKGWALKVEDPPKSLKTSFAPYYFKIRPS